MADRYAFISAHGYMQFVEIEYEDFLTAAHDLLECKTIEMAAFADGQFLLTLDEVGKLTGKPRNSFATKLYANPNDFIVGNALMGLWGLRDGESDIVGINDRIEVFLRDLAELDGVRVLEDLRYQRSPIGAV